MRVLSLLVVLSFGFSAPVFSDVDRNLPRGTPESQGIASADVLAFVETADRDIDTMNSFMLLRGGQVVAEGWWAPYGPASPHVLYSLTKSFTSTAVGMAIAEGRLSLHDPVLGFFPDLAPENPDEHLKAMRVHDLLRMATGHETEAPVREGNASWAETFLAHPVPHRPGTHFLYNTPATHMLSEIVQRVTGETTEDYLRPRLFQPLGIDDPRWLKSPQGVTIGGYGLSVTTEDIARFGQLYLQQGRWKDRQLLPREWVAAATSLQVANGSNPASDWNQGYGYQFWRSRHSSYRGDGAFGQYCIVMPDQDAVVAITSGVADMQAVMSLVFEKLLPAFRAAPLPENPPATMALNDALATLTVRLPAGEATAPRGRGMVGHTYVFPENELGMESLTLDAGSGQIVVTVRTADGEQRIPVGLGGWAQSRSRFVFGLDASPGLPTEAAAIAAAGAWPEKDSLVIKLVMYETPYYTKVSLRFDGAELHLATEANVSFAPERRIELVGRRS